MNNSKNQLPKYLILAHWLFELNEYTTIQDACEYMNVSVPSIRRYLKSMQSCNHIIDLSVRYSDVNIMGIKVNNIIPYKYVPGRLPQPKSPESDLRTQKGLGCAYFWQKLTSSSWSAISF
ncbi:hypothetical protein [Aeromonas veronii]|uniref:hypothetical protein n=1 Tax=Aeromonas veronii TaxID=654 RepID=UPI001267C2E8|nr:hypothetical protein [Aeromonas veronii]